MERLLLKGKHMESEIKIRHRLSAWHGAQVIFFILMILVITIMLPLFIFNITISLKSTINPSEVPSIFGQTPLVVETTVMSDAGINSGDMIFINSVQASDIEEQDIVAFGFSGSIVISQVVSINEVNGVVTLDLKNANNTSDNLNYSGISSSAIIGLYNGVNIAGVGNIIIFLQTPMGILLAIAIPALIIMGFVLIRNKYHIELVEEKVALAESINVATLSKQEELKETKLKALDKLEKEHIEIAPEKRNFLYNETAQNKSKNNFIKMSEE